MALIIRNKQTINEAILIKSKIKVTNYKSDGCYWETSVLENTSCNHCLHYKYDDY